MIKAQFELPPENKSPSVPAVSPSVLAFPINPCSPIFEELCLEFKKCVKCNKH